MSDNKVLPFKQTPPHGADGIGDGSGNGGSTGQSRLSAIMAADVAGYTQLIEKDASGTVEAWKSARNDHIEPGVAKSAGRIIKFTGDGFLAEFSSVQAAVECAIRLQEALKSGLLVFRIGISMGDIIDDGKDVHGEDVNIAARLESIADPGGICISSDVYNQVRNKLDEPFEDWGKQDVKHVSLPVRVYALKRFAATKGKHPVGKKGKAGAVIFTRTALALAMVLAVAGSVWFVTPVKKPATPKATPTVDANVVADVNVVNVAQGPFSDGETFADCTVCPEMTVVPTGAFTMGYAKGFPDEKPPIRVTITNRFAVGKFEITFKQWEACVAHGGCGAYRPKGKGWGRGDHPVIFVSWHDAQAYVTWLSGVTGKNYRLLSEAEWEYVARAGLKTLYPWGNTIDAGKANYGGFRAKTTPVGHYDANQFGLHDMVGNAWEWVADCYLKDAYRSHDAYPAVVGGTGDSCRRLLRGGAWDTDTSDGVHRMRTTIRKHAKADGRYANYGFRAARNLN